jgi:hypothetical protein
MAILSIPTSVAGVSIPSGLFNPNSPLALLYGGLGVKTYKYPSDLATSPSKSHYVQFSISEIIPASYSGGGQVPLNENLIEGDSVGLPGFGGLLQESSSMSGDESSWTESSTGLIELSENSGGGGFGALVSKGLKISPTRTQPKAFVSLYMPDTLNAQYNSTYDELKLTDLGSTINTLRTIDQLAGPAKSIVESYKAGGGGLGGLESAAKQFGNIAGTDPAAISLITRGGAALANRKGFGVNAGALEDVLLKGQGYAINPQLQMIYRGIGLRSFQLSFVFTPNSQGEANEVNYIINLFKYHFAPTLISAKEVSSDSMYLVPPSIFSIEFMIGGKENPFLPKYGNCVLTDIDVNFAPNGWAAYDDGAPVQSTLTMTFKETEILDKGKIQKGYYGVEGGLR